MRVQFVSFSPVVAAWAASAGLLLGLLCAPRVAHAYRPFDGTDGDVAELGEFELELGPLQYTEEGKGKLWSAPTVLNLGVIPRMELVMDFVPYYPRHGGPTEVRDTDVFAKYLLREGVLQEKSGPSIALEAGPLIPELRGERGFGASADLIVSERWSWLTLHLNTESQLSRTTLDFLWSESLIAEAELGGPVRPVMELSWEIQPNAHEKAYGVLGGAIWKVTEGLAFDAAARIGRSAGERVAEVRFGLTWAMPVWHAHGEEPDGGMESASR